LAAAVDFRRIFRNLHLANKPGIGNCVKCQVLTPVRLLFTARVVYHEENRLWDFTILPSMTW
jgi:hypothetical protein